MLCEDKDEVPQQCYLETTITEHFPRQHVQQQHMKLLKTETEHGIASMETYKLCLIIAFNFYCSSSTSKRQ